MLADVILHFDSLDFEYTNIANDKKQPSYIRQGAERARGVLNKYYELSDSSHMYRIGMRKRFRIHYLEVLRLTEYLP